MAVTAKKIIAKANSQIGVKEKPANSNNVKYNTDYYGKPVSGASYPWCCAFVWDIFRLCNASRLFCGGSKTAYCPTVESYAKIHKQFYANNKGKAGDLCLMDFGKGRASHIGIVKAKNADGSYQVIEGNTSTTSNDNGGSVMLRTRKTSVIRGFYRPKYEEAKKEETESLPTIKNGSKGSAVTKWQKYLVSKKYSVGKSGADGVFGEATETATRKFQKAKKLTVDGVVGKNTWKAAGLG